MIAWPQMAQKLYLKVVSPSTNKIKDVTLMRLKGKYIWLLTGALLLSGVALAVEVGLGKIKPGRYNLTPINNHLPYAFKDPDDYRESLQKVQLELGNQERFRDLPELGMKHPYTGVIELGDKPQQFGIIVDVRAEEKRLYIDTDGDGSFAGEPWIQLLNEWYGLETYWVIGPEPIQLKVDYNSVPSGSRPLEISVYGFLNRPGALIEEKPYLMVAVRTWFLAELIEEGGVKLAAITDRNNNGKYNDPEDAFFIDYNDDGLFDETELILCKELTKIKSGKAKLKIDWGIYPETIEIRGEDGG